mgnify:CR=1 FL=1
MTAQETPTGPKHLDTPTLTDEQKEAAFAAAAHTVETGGLPQGDGGLADPNRKNAYHFDELVPTQIQHKARSVIRTFVVSLIGTGCVGRQGGYHSACGPGGHDHGDRVGAGDRVRTVAAQY